MQINIAKALNIISCHINVNKMCTIFSSYPFVLFSHRALIRPLPSQQMFDHVRKRHRVFFVYIGGESPLKEKYIDAASELIVYTYFFSASEDVVPEYVTLKEMPAVLVFKDDTYFVYDV